MTKWLPLLALPALTLLVTGCASTPNFLSSNSRTADAGLSTTERQLSMARLGERHGQAETAAKIYQKVLLDDPNNVEALHRLGVMAAKKQDYQQAINYLAQAEQSEPNNAELLNDLGYAYYLTDDLRTAEVKLRQAVRIEPGHQAARNNLGLVLGNAGRWDECLTEFKYAVGEAEAYANLAFVQVQVGEFAKAEQSFHSALDLDADLQAAAEGLVQLKAKKDLLEKRFIADYQSKQNQNTNTLASENKPSPPEQQRPADSRFVAATSLPLDTQPLDTQPLDTQPLDTQPLDTQPLDTQPRDEQPRDEQPVEIEVVSHDDSPNNQPADIANADLIASIEDGRDITPQPAANQPATHSLPVIVEQPIATTTTEASPASPEPRNDRLPVITPAPPVITPAQPETSASAAPIQPTIIQSTNVPSFSFQPITVATDSVQPVNVQPIKVQPIKVAPVAVQPANVEKPQVTPVTIEPIKVAPPTTPQLGANQGMPVIIPLNNTPTTPTTQTTTTSKTSIWD